MVTSRIVLALGLISVAGVGLAEEPPTVGRADGKARSAPGDAGPAELIQQYRRASQPGAEHRQLDALVGAWDMDIHFIGEDGTTTRVPGRSENRWVLGRRFVLCEATTSRSDLPLESITIYGYDQTEQRFFSVGLSTLSTSFLPATGTYDAASHSFVLSGRQRDAVSGQAAFYRTVLRVENPDRYVVEVFVDYGARGPLKVLETVYTRSKATDPGSDRSR